MVSSFITVRLILCDTVLTDYKTPSKKLLEGEVEHEERGGVIKKAGGGLYSQLSQRTSLLEGHLVLLPDPFQSFYCNSHLKSGFCSE